MAAFMLGPGVKGSVCEPFMIRFSISHSTLGFLDLSPLAPFWGLMSLLQVPSVVMPDAGLVPFLGKTLHIYEIPPDCGLCASGGGFW